MTAFSDSDWMPMDTFEALPEDALQQLENSMPHRQFAQGEHLIHQGEERDLCLRMLDTGYEIHYLKTPPIIHNPSQNRDHTRVAYLGLGNTLLFDVVNVPFPDVLWRLPADVILLLKHRITLGGFPRRVWYTVRALFACIRFLPQRRPVSRATYSRFKNLPAHGAVAPDALKQVLLHDV